MCGCRGGGGARRATSGRRPGKSVRNGVVPRQAGIISLSAQNSKIADDIKKKQLGAQSQRVERRGLTRERREIERKRRLALAKKLGK